MEIEKAKYADMQVELVDYMGSDVNVVNAARVSFAKKVEKFDEHKDAKLINYLAKHNHWSPFAHTAITLRIKAPIFLARQFVKHQVGGAYNEESRRYIESTPEFYCPDVWRGKPENAKQGSSDEEIDIVEYFGTDGKNGQEDPYYNSVAIALETYNGMLEKGVAPELARLVLPQSAMTNWVWTGGVMFFARVYKLRIDGHAQKEAQELAQKIEDVVAPIYPHSWQALKEHLKV